MMIAHDDGHDYGWMAVRRTTRDNEVECACARLRGESSSPQGVWRLFGGVECRRPAWGASGLVGQRRESRETRERQSDLS